jgi:hypothetical protein
MFKKQIFSDEVGDLDRLIAAISSEIETERAAVRHQDGILQEMEDAVAELRLRRGIRLMLMGAQGAKYGGTHHQTGRRVV